MNFWESIQETINEGLAASKILLNNTTQTIKDLGQEGAIRFEILQLKTQAEKLSAKLGALVFQNLKENNGSPITGQEDFIAPLLQEIEQLKAKINQKAEQLENLKKSR